MRRLYLAYRDRLPLTGTAPGVSGPGPAAQILPTPSTGSGSTEGGDARGNDPFTLSWSHYPFLIGIKDESARSFYEIELQSTR